MDAILATLAILILIYSLVILLLIACGRRP